MRNVIHCLMLDFWLVACGVTLLAAAPPDKAGRSDLESARRTLHEMEEHFRLARSVDEFVAGIDFFDEHLYGRVKSGLANSEQVTQLESVIKTKNAELEKMMNNPPSEFTNGGTNIVTPDTRTYYNTIYTLESDIAAMLAEMKTLQAGTGAGTATELLDGSLWREKTGGSLLDPGGEDLGKAVERYRKLLHELEKKTGTHPGASAGRAGGSNSKP